MSQESVVEKIMKMDEATWQRHANPWSGWTRFVTLPVLTLTIWSRVWIGWWSLLPILGCVVWLWANPRAFGVPKKTDNWMSRSIFGERIWLSRKKTPLPRHHQRLPGLLNIGGMLALIIYVIGLYHLDVRSTVLGLSLVILFKLWFLDRMVWLYLDTND